MTGIDRHRAQAAVRELLLALGEDPDRAEIQETPQRVAAAFAEWCSGVGVDPQQHLQDAVAAGVATGEVVALRDIKFESLCEHHLLPFRGVAHIAYLPQHKIVGLGALARVTATLAARPQMQERLGEEIAAEISKGTQAHGVLVVLEAKHGCLSDRGPKQEHAVAVTVAATGELKSGQKREEAMLLLQAPA